MPETCSGTCVHFCFRSLLSKTICLYEDMQTERWEVYSMFFSKTWFFLLLFSAEDSDIGLGICGWLLTAFSWAIVIVTLPFSLCVCFKVRNALVFSSQGSLRGGGWGRPRPPNFWNNKNIKVCVSCSWPCLGTLRLAQHTWRGPLLSWSSGSNAQSGDGGSCLEEQLRNVFTNKGIIDLPSRQIITYLALLIFDCPLTTLQSIMNATLSKQMFWHCYENGLIKTIQTIPHNLYVSFKLTSFNCGLRLYPGLP